MFGISYEDGHVLALLLLGQYLVIISDSTGGQNEDSTEIPNNKN